MFKDIACNSENSKDDFENLSKEEQKILIRWIKKELIPSTSINRDNSSYGLKHRFEEAEEGFYITNSMFKGEMLKCGFKVANPEAINWYFNIMKKSPAIVRFKYKERIIEQTRDLGI